jgi:hypothetical protein
MRLRTGDPTLLDDLRAHFERRATQPGTWVELVDR